MADFDTPFADNSNWRLPTTDEQQNGFPCGRADVRLFNGLFHQLQAELDEIHEAGGVTKDNTVYTTTRDAIQNMIDLAGGGTGDAMSKGIYDPLSVNDNAFNMDNMQDGEDYHLYPTADRDKLASLTVGGASSFAGLTDTPVDFTAAANKLLAVNSAEDGVEFITPASGGSSIWNQSVASITGLKNIDVSALAVDTRVFVDSYHASYNKGGGGFILIDSASEVDDGGHIIEPNVAVGNKKWLRMNINRMTANVINFGAKGDGVADDTTAIQNAYASIRTYAYNTSGLYWTRYNPGAKLLFPPTRPYYLVSDEFIFDTRTIGLTISGDSCAAIVSNNRDKPIFNIQVYAGSGYPGNLQRGGIIKNLWMGYHADLAISSSDTNAIAIKLDGSNGGPFLGMNIHNMFFRNVGSAISGDGNYSMLDLKHLWVQGYALDGISLDGSVGTNCSLKEVFMQGSLSEGFYTVRLKDCNSVNVQVCSFECGSEADNAPQILLSECPSSSFNAVRFERGTCADGHRFISCGGFTVGDLTINDLELTNHDILGTCTLIRNNFRNKMTVLGTVQVSQMKFASGSQLLVTDSQGASMIRWLANFRGINADAGGAGTPTYRMHVGDAYECEYANMVPICFGKEAIGSDDAALSLKHNYSAVIRVPDNCAITDLQINYSGNKSAGTLTAQVYKEGSPIAGAVVGASTGTNATGKKRFSPFGDSNTGDNLQFKRGERLEIKYTSSGMSTSGGDVSVTAGVVPWAIELS